MQMTRMHKVDRNVSDLVTKDPKFAQGTLVVLDGGQYLVVGDGVSKFTDIEVVLGPSVGPIDPGDGQT